MEHLLRLEMDFLRRLTKAVTCVEDLPSDATVCERCLVKLPEWFRLAICGFELVP